jgi:hypothetical protein
LRCERAAAYWIAFYLQGKGRSARPCKHGWTQSSVYPLCIASLDKTSLRASIAFSLLLLSSVSSVTSMVEIFVLVRANPQLVSEPHAVIRRRPIRGR